MLFDLKISASDTCSTPVCNSLWLSVDCTSVKKTEKSLNTLISRKLTETLRVRNRVCCAEVVIFHIFILYHPQRFYYHDPYSRLETNSKVKTLQFSVLKGSGLSKLIKIKLFFKAKMTEYKRRQSVFLRCNLCLILF